MSADGTERPGDESNVWPLLSTLVEIGTPWLRIVGERRLDAGGSEVDYWRIEKADSLLIVLRHSGRIVLPAPSYRPGVDRRCLDLAGGRIDRSKDLASWAAKILRREFQLPAELDLGTITLLNEVGQDVDSSSSNQQLFGALVDLDAGTIDAERIGASFEATAEGCAAAIAQLRCVQCRAILSDLARSGLL